MITQEVFQAATLINVTFVRLPLEGGFGEIAIVNESTGPEVDQFRVAVVLNLVPRLTTAALPGPAIKEAALPAWDSLKSSIETRINLKCRIR